MSSAASNRSSARLQPHLPRAAGRLIQYLINRKRANEGLKLAEERIYPDEEESLQSISASFGGYMLRTYRPGLFERGGNTKTHGIVRPR